MGKQDQLGLGESPSEPPPAMAAEKQAEPPPTAAALPTTLATAEPEPPGPDRAISAFSSEQNFAGAQRMAIALSKSSLVPEAYRGPTNLPNVLIAIELASRIGASVLMVMQNLDIIHGRPSWRAQFLIATVNACGRFTPLRYRFEGKLGTDDYGCRAWASDRATGEECIGPLITIGLAKAEGWFQRNGSKWKTLPELMLHYRSAAFWARIYAPELSLGMNTREEVIDTYGEAVATPDGLTPGNSGALEAALRSKTNGATEATEVIR